MGNSAAVGARVRGDAGDDTKHLAGSDDFIRGASKGSNGFCSFSGILSSFDSLFPTLCIYRVVYNEYVFL